MVVVKTRDTPDMEAGYECTSLIGRNVFLGIDLDHTADIQVHAWGTTLEESFTQCAYALFDYMTERSAVEEEAALTENIEIVGGDVQTLLSNLLDELLFRFSVEPFLVVTRMDVQTIDIPNGVLRATM